MHNSLPKPAPLGPPRLPERADQMAKTAVRKADIEVLREVWREHVGTAMKRARQLSGLSLKEFAALVGRDERQVARWENGQERPQFDALFAPECLRQPMVIALAELAGNVEIETTIRVRRLA